MLLFFFNLGGDIDVNTKQVLSIIDTLRDGWYEPPYTYNIKKMDFMLKSYSRSAMNEIKLYLMENDQKDPISVLEDFRYMVDHFPCNTEDADANFMFSVYYDVATDVLDTLLTMKER